VYPVYCIPYNKKNNKDRFNKNNNLSTRVKGDKENTVYKRTEVA